MECGPLKKFMQVVVGVTLFLLMLVSMVFNKVSLVWLLGGTIINSVRLETWYAAFWLVLLVPEAVALLKVLWNTSFIKQTLTHQWPSGVALFVGFLVSFAEVSSFMVFTLEVAPRLPVQVLLPLLSSVFAVQLCHELWEDVKFIRSKKSEVKYDGNFTLAQRSADHRNTCHTHQGSLQNWKRILKTVIGFSGVWSSCAISSIVALTTTLPWFQALCLPACLCLLSLCWHPKVQIYIVRSSDGSFAGRWKAMCLYTVFKILILMIGLSVVMVIRLQAHGVLDKSFFLKLGDGLYACRHKEIFYPLIIHFVTGFMGHVLAYVSATLCMTGIGITLPSLLATPTAIAMVMYLCAPGFVWLDEVMCYSRGTGIWCACVLAGITWIAPYVIRGKYFMRNAYLILKPYDELFIQPTWNSIFLEQHMCLNYKPEGFTPTDHIYKSETDAISRIFICTTMYREADFEMGRLLKSLHKVSQSEKLKNVYLEAHIFLDNGTQDFHLTDFATQLVSLLESKMQVNAQAANAYQTPYGVQLNWTLPGGMPFFIHMKDSSKIKARKRWSQVMYMSYVLNYRVLRDHSRDKAVPVPHERIAAVTDDSLFVGYASDKEWEKNTAALSSREMKMQGTDISPTPSANTNGSQTPFYVRDNRRHLARMFNIDSDKQADSSKQHCSSTPITNLINAFGPEILQQISSDQGIGNSDDMSVSSMGSSNRDDTESSAHPSRQSSIKERDDCGEYEGDLSSNNENSLTSLKAKRAKSFLVYEREKPIPEIVRTHNSAPDRPLRPVHYGMPDRPTRPKRPQHPPRHIKHKPKKDAKSSPKAQLLQNCERQDSNESSKSYSGSGAVNTAFTLNNAPAPSSLPPGALPAVSLSHLKEAIDTEMSSQNKKEPDVFVISRKSVPSFKSMNKKRIPLDDHTYILATDADMEFNDDSVMDLLNLCNQDRRLGGACGRTHPHGQKTGPLVWYQKFEYAKDFWMIKSAQNVIGSVMCCPGCFSLYRAAAVRDVMANYAGPTTKPFDVFVKDTGEDRWMCTLMMLNGWKLEYTAFCDNATFCPDTFEEFMKQRRRWVLSDMANMVLVFKNIFKLLQKNDSFSIAYILYMLQMFIIVLLSPASTVVILAGGLDIVYGMPFEIMGPLLGVLVLLYALVCILGSFKMQTRITFLLTVFMGLAMLLVVIGGSVYVIHDISSDLQHGTVHFQEYYLILLLIAALIFAALIHCKETWLMAHGLSYLLGFPAMQILLPIYAICNMVDQSWGTRDQNMSTSPPVSCFSKNRKKYHKSLSKKSQLPEAGECPVELEEEGAPIQCTNRFLPMAEGSGQCSEEFVFWDKMSRLVLGTDVNLGLDSASLTQGLRSLRNTCLLSMLVLNALWLLLLSVLYFNADFNLARLNVYGLIAAAVYGMALFIQLLGMSVHRTQAIFIRLGRAIFGDERTMWIYPRTGN